MWYYFTTAAIGGAFRATAAAVRLSLNLQSE